MPVASPPIENPRHADKLQKTLRDLGIEKAGLHAFRHMAASELMEAGQHQALCSVKCVTVIRESRFKHIRTSSATRSAKRSIHSPKARWVIELESSH
jgi:hypothetical protein